MGRPTEGPLHGRVAFITGAARGQGRAHAVRLAADGANVIAVDLCDQIASVPYPLATADDLAATVKLVEDTGARIVAKQGDVRDRESLSAALQAGLDEFGRLDIVVANAGIAPMQSGDDGWRDVIDVNLTGVYNTIKAAIPAMVKQGTGGSIVLISSAAGLAGVGSPDAGSVGYAAAKHGMVGLMRVYANLLARQNIRVNSIHPSGVDTPMINNEFTREWLAKMAAANDTPGALGNAMPVEVLQAEDIANAVAWLVSDQARYITGVYNTIKAAIPAMVKQGTGGSIVLISSAAGLAGVGSPDAGSVGYAAAKHGMVGLMRVYANLLARQNIRVNSIHPSGVETPMINNEFTREWLAKMAAQTDQPRSLGNALPVEVLQAEDIANAVAWLVSDQARYITGVTLPVDAGFLNK